MKLAAIAAALAAHGCYLLRGDDGRCAPNRTIAITTQDDVAAFAGCTRARGLVVRTSAPLDLVPLGTLREIDGDLIVGPTASLESAGFNALERVGGAIRVTDNGALRGLYLPRLLDAGRVAIDANPTLRTVAMPRIAAIHGPFAVTDNGTLELLTASSLVAVERELVVAGQPKLANLEVAHLAAADGVRLEDDPQLPAELVARLAKLPAALPPPDRAR